MCRVFDSILFGYYTDFISYDRLSGICQGYRISREMIEFYRYTELSSTQAQAPIPTTTPDMIRIKLKEYSIPSLADNGPHSDRGQGPL